MSKIKCSCGVELYSNRWQDHYKVHPECKINNEALKKEKYELENIFVCEWCKNRFKKPQYLIRHQINDCKVIPPDKIPLSEDQLIQKSNKETGIQCLICHKFQRELGYHLTQKHHVSIDDYCTQFNLTKDKLKSDLSKQKRHVANTINGKIGSDKIQEMMLDPEYKKERGQKISQGILDSEYAIETRKQTMTQLNKSNEFRFKSSETMKNTWTENTSMSDFSHQWQKDDPDRLKEVLIKVRSHENFNCFQSKPEKEIRRWLKEDLGYKLNSGRFFIEGHNRFFDVRIDDVLIEIDGPWHFKEFFFLKDGSYRFIERRYDPTIDILKENFALENGYYLLRISNWGDSIEDQKNIIKIFLEQKHNLKKNIYKRGKKYD